MSSPPDRKTKKQVPVADQTQHWANPYPLEGDPHRPAVIITNLLSKSPRLIGWNDERIEQRALAAYPDIDEEEIKEFHIGPKREVVNEVAFGLLGIATKEITKQLMNMEENKERARSEEEAIKLVQRGEEASPNPNNELVKGSKKAGADNATIAGVDTPHDAPTIRDSELYQLALRSLLFQRDNYLVGKDYADQRNAQRRHQQRLHSVAPFRPSLHLPLSRMPDDATALGNLQIGGLLQWFIPSPTVHRALLPIVVGLPTGALNEPILRAVANLIPLAQPNLDNVVKERIIWFLKDEHWRGVIKNSTKGYIANTYRDSPQG